MKFQAKTAWVRIGIEKFHHGRREIKAQVRKAPLSWYFKADAVYVSESPLHIFPCISPCEIGVKLYFKKVFHAKGVKWSRVTMIIKFVPFATPEVHASNQSYPQDSYVFSLRASREPFEADFPLMRRLFCLIAIRSSDLREPIALKSTKPALQLNFNMLQVQKFPILRYHEYLCGST